MTKLTKYLRDINKNEKQLSKQIFNSYTWFDYPDEYIFKLDLELLVSTVYDGIKIIDTNSTIRLSQGEFRYGLMDLYSCRCVISSNSNPDELEAAHIIGVADGGDYQLANGLILEANLHKTFDKYQWVINPDTLEIEVNPKYIGGSIVKYRGQKLNINICPILYSNLKLRYNKFVSMCV
jgi:predicted restriction endonuclease